MDQFIRGAQFLLAGGRQLTDPYLRSLVITPLIIALAIMVLFWGGIFLLAGKMITFLEQLLPLWLGWLSTIATLLLMLVTLLVSGFLYGIIATLVGAPFHEMLAKQVLRQGGLDVPDLDLADEVGPALGREFIKIRFLLPRLLGVTALALIPPVNLVAGPLWALFNAWALSLEFLDYPAAAAGDSFEQLREDFAANRSIALGFGGALSLALAIPVVNVIAIPAAVIGASLLWHEQLQQPAPPI